jgi:hypothetical protein
VNGRDSRRIALVRFLVGAKRVARDRTPPYVRRIRLRRTSHDRIYSIRARVRLVDGRKLTLRRDVRACAAGHHGA